MFAGKPSGSSFPGETDIDADLRVTGGTVDIGADEVACTMNIYNRADLDADGIVNFYDFALFGNAWRGHDPNDPDVKSGHIVVEQELLDRWTPLCNFNSDYVIDLKDMQFFADNWLWRACWYRQAPDPLPPHDYSIVLYGSTTYDPNEPYDPNDLIDPNDFFGMISMGLPAGAGGMEAQSAFMAEPVSESGLTAADLEELIAFLNNNVLTEPALTQEETDNLLEFLKDLQQELDAIYEMQPFGLYVQ